MTNTLNRRQAMTGVAAIAAGATIATTALAGTTDLDQHLVDLFTKWQGLQRGILDATNKADMAEFAARKAYPKPPQSILEKFKIENGGVTTHERIEFFYYQQVTVFNNTSDRTKTVYKKRHAALDKWEADKKHIYLRHNVPALLQALADITAKQKAVEIELINTPAKGLTGVQVKLSFWAYWNLDDGTVENDFVETYPCPESHAIKQALIDLQRLTGQIINATV